MLSNNTKSPVTHIIYRKALTKQIHCSQKKIRENIESTGSKITHRTQARNCKAPNTLHEEQKAHKDIMAEQIKAWRVILPTLIRKFSRINDYRRAKSVKHKIVVLMIFGLLAFVFRLSSRREMNRELTSAVVNKNLRKIFPELDSIPHADTLARLLENIGIKKIEEAHIALMKEQIHKKKFKNLLINGCIPISVDGAQKLFRDGILHDSHWLQRTVGKDETVTEQQYVYIIEANISLKNGLNIPLLTEYLYMDNNQLINSKGKQDSELHAFIRMADKLKGYFPRLKIIMFMDALFATQGVMGILHENKWNYVIKFSKQKNKHFAKLLNKKRNGRMTIPNQSHYRGRRQEFYWVNNIEYGYAFELNISLIACLERREEINQSTGAIEIHYSEHTWISSIAFSIEKAHEMCNLGARMKESIEDSFNTEKNRGYHYKHAYSYNWNAMQGFHLLMRLGHAINALSTFTKKLKKYMKENGCSAMLKKIKEIIFNPWFDDVWYTVQYEKKPQLRFKME
jgi:hypothetical protein